MSMLRLKIFWLVENVQCCLVIGLVMSLCVFIALVVPFCVLLFEVDDDDWLIVEK